MKGNLECGTQENWNGLVSNSPAFHISFGIPHSNDDQLALLIRDPGVDRIWILRSKALGHPHGGWVRKIDFERLKRRMLEKLAAILTRVDMPIYEYYCPGNHTIYQFYAKSLAQGRILPRCPDNPKFQLVKMVSTFAVQSGGKKGETDAASEPAAGANPAEDAKMEAAMGAMEREFSSVDENDPRAMGRMMRRMAELTGEKIDGEMEEVVRKLEEGADPDALEEQMGSAFPDEGGEGDPYGQGGEGPNAEPEPLEKKTRYRVRRPLPRRDPQLYDYE